MLQRYTVIVAAATIVTLVMRAEAPADTLTGAPTYGATTKAGAAIRQAYADTFTRAIAVYPEVGTFLGDYTHDDSWSDPSAAGVAKGKELIDTLDRQLDAVDMSDATLQDRDDLLLAKAFVANQRRGIADAIAGRDPGAAPLAIVGAVYTMIVQKPGQDDRVWWNNMISRLEKAPAFLAAARPAVANPGKLQGIVASEELGQAAGLFYGVLNPMTATLSAEQKARYEKARDATIAAVSAWKKWIDDNDQSWPDNFSMGAVAYDTMLKNELLLPYSAADIERIGYDTLNRAVAEESWIETQAKARGVKFDATQGGGPTPLDAKTEYAFFAHQVKYLRDFIQRNQIVTVPTYVGQINILPTPSFLLPILPGASMNPPPLLSDKKDGQYFIPPPNPNMAKLNAQGAIFQDFDRDRVLGTSGHEGFPGHFLQLSIAKHNPDPLRRLSFDGVFSEGWAFYEEEMLDRMGLYGSDLDGRYAIAQFERLRGARAVVDARLATGEWTFDNAVKWFQQNAGVDPNTAQGEVRRHALGPGQAFDYAVGKVQIEDLLSQYRAKKGTGFTLRGFHDDLLSHGTVPVSIVAKEMLGEQ
jgi:uncharacterized protein (DUF885 family)